MESSSCPTKPGVVTATYVWRVPFAPSVVLENVFDSHHVSHVHRETIKSCRVLREYGKVTVLLYELIPIRWLRWYTKPFIVLKTATSSAAGGEVRFISLPVSTSVVSDLIVRARPAPSGGGATVEHLVRLCLARWLRPFARLILWLRHRGELRRWEQDDELMRFRTAAMQSGHVDNPRCVERETLFEEWFGKDQEDARACR